MLTVDGHAITENNRRSWQHEIGYVPQQIYLADGTVAADVDNLHGFVADELPLRFQTTVGKCGVRLSGGQRQRIGIARALYPSPQVLIL